MSNPDVHYQLCVYFLTLVGGFFAVRSRRVVIMLRYFKPVIFKSKNIGIPRYKAGVSRNQSIGVVWRTR